MFHLLKWSHIYYFYAPRKCKSAARPKCLMLWTMVHRWKFSLSGNKIDERFPTQFDCSGLALFWNTEYTLTVIHLLIYINNVQLKIINFVKWYIVKYYHIICMLLLFSCVLAINKNKIILIHNVKSKIYLLNNSS